MLRQRGTCGTVVLAVVLSAVAWNAGGCRTLSFFMSLIPKPAKTVQAEFSGLDGKTIAIVIEAKESLVYEWPDVRRRLSEVIRGELVRNLDDVVIVPPLQVIRYQDANLRWHSMNRAELGRKFGADYVLEVVLEDYGIREPGSASLYRGRVRATGSLFDTSRLGRHGAVWRNADIHVSYPEDGRPISRIMGNIGELRDEAERRFAKVLVRKFYDYKIEKEM